MTFLGILLTKVADRRKEEKDGDILEWRNNGKSSGGEILKYFVYLFE